MYKFLGRLTTDHPWAVCLVWLVAGVVLTCLAPQWDSRAQDDDIRFLPSRCASVRGYQLLEKAFPQDVFASRLIFALERPNGTLREDDFKLVDRIVQDLDQLRHDEPGLKIGRISCYHDPFIGKRLISEDGQCTLIQLALGTPYLAVQTQATVDRAEACVREQLQRVGADAPELSTTGPGGVGRDLISAGAHSLHITSIATVLLVIVVLLIVYRSPLLALVPLLTIGMSVWVALNILALMTLIPGFYLVNVSQIFAVVMLYGAGTDYCLFLISRYREELSSGLHAKASLSRGVTTVAGALVASAGTVICGLGMMGLAEFAKVRCGGPAIALSLAVALLASLTLTPSLLRLFGKSVFWPRPFVSTTEQLRTSGPSDLWERISHQVVRRPGWILAATVLVLLPLALLGVRVRANYRATSELAPSCSSVQGLGVIQRHFTAGETGPITLLLASPHDWNDKDGRRFIAHLSQAIVRIDNVAEVRSLTQPLGTPLDTLLPVTSASMSPWLRSLSFNVSSAVASQADRTACEFYLAQTPADTPDEQRHVTRLDVVLKTDPFDPRSTATLELLQTWLHEDLTRPVQSFGPVQTECFGITVNARDLAEVTESDRARINLFVLGGIFLILLVLVRKPWLAAYLLATVLFSYYVTLGMTTLAAHWWNARPVGLVDWRVPFFLFTILVAVGEDYNILLITRAMQERKRHGAVEGMRRALARTGGTITSCGLIMAGTFATLMLSGLGTLIQIGFALAFGVLLDTFVMRPFLVPAFTILMWRRSETAAPRPSAQVPPRLRRAS